MRAVLCTRYGGPDVLQIATLPKPSPGKREMLVRVMASSVNSGDVRVRGLAVSGFLRIVMRIVLGFTKPRKPVLGTVFSGVVEQTGEEVSTFKPGDEVFGLTGFRFGAHAEYLVCPAGSVVHKKPSNATFEEAAAIAFGGQTAVYFLKKAGIESLSNPRVLIYGATGSVGTAAVQLALHYGASVTAVCSSAGESLARQLGADQILLYDQQDFAQVPSKFDIVFDAVGKTTKKQCAPLLDTKGKYLTVGGLDVADEQVEQLQLLAHLFDQGQFNPTIDRTYSLDEIAEAHRYVDTGRKKGNVVLKVAR